MASHAGQIEGGPVAPTEERGARQAFALDAIGSLTILIATVLFLWQAVTYRGLIAWLGELQFDWIGRYYPTQTCLLLILLCSIPGLLMLRAAERRRARTGAALAEQRLGLTIRVLFALALACLLTAVAGLLLSLRLPDDSGPPRAIRADTAPVGVLPNGPAELTGAINYLRTAALEEDVWLSRRNSVFAPIGAGGGRTPEVRFFVELDRGQRAAPGAAAPPAVETRRGILKRDSLPGEVLRLYRYAGITVPQPYYVLYRDRATLRWPYLSVAVQLGLVALVLAAAGLVLLALRRRDERRAREAADAATVEARPLSLPPSS